MAVNLTTPVTGAAQTGLTSPTYTITADSAPSSNGKQWAVTALGGTQTGVNVNAATRPFTVSVFRPVSYKQVGVPNPSTGVIPNIQNNVHKVITRKGVQPALNQPYRNVIITTTVEVPAGAEVYDDPNVRAALSLHLGSLAQASAGFGDTVVSGVL